MRWLNHLFTTRWHVARAFEKRALDAIEAAVAASEQTHRGEIRFAVEAAFDFAQLRAGLTPRARAQQVFAELGVWDTDENNGVLIYVLLAERAVEIVADRGYRGRVSDQEWRAVTSRMTGSFADGDFELGAVHGIAAVGALLAREFPGSGRDPDELPNRPSVL